MRKSKKRIILEAVPIEGYAAEGKALARHEGKVIFVKGAIPGDTADLLLLKNKKDWAEAQALRITQPSADRLSPFCKHFGHCGGCKWQMLPYSRQLQFKQQEVEDNLKRIGKIELPPIMPIIGSGQERRYRNKLEFTFSNKRFFTDLNEAETAAPSPGALGFHVAQLYNKVLAIDECHLMDEINDRIRNSIRSIAEQHGFSYYDIKEHQGWLRNIIVRHSSLGETMVNIIIHEDATADRELLLREVLKHNPDIDTLLYTVNPKWNDSIYDLQPVVYHGNGFIKERLQTGEEGRYYDFLISPKSFFQTNSSQAEQLYRITAEFAALTGSETVYDLYCGTGSIGIFLSHRAGKIIGVETVEEAVEDAKKNASLNGIEHAEFYAGDVIKVCNDAFFEKHGRPDVVITDPPRAGMHEKLVEKLLEIEAPRIVYVSCNTATQARDLQLLNAKYKVEKIRPVDMFPHTHHIECVVALTLR